MQLNLLVVGAGMYTCGRGTNGLGTILPSLFEFHRQHDPSKTIEKIVFMVRSDEARNELELKIHEAERLFSFSIPYKIKQEVSLSRVITDEKIDAAIIATPDNTHFHMAKEIIENKVHTMVVKPLTPEYETSLKLADLADEFGVIGMVDFHKRFDLANVKIKDLIQDNVLGDIDHIIVNYSQKYTIPSIHFKKWSEQTNVFQYLGVHYADLIYFLTGATPTDVTSKSSGRRLKNLGLNCSDSVITHIQWQLKDKCFQSTHFTSWNDPSTSPAMSNQRIEIVGEKSRLASDQMNRGLSYYDENHGLEYINPYFSQIYKNYPGNQIRAIGYGPTTYHAFLNILCRKILSNRISLKGIPTFRDVLTAAKIIELSNKSLTNSNKPPNTNMKGHFA